MHILSGEHGMLYPNQGINVETAEIPVVVPPASTEPPSSPQQLSTTQPASTANIRDALRVVLNALTTINFEDKMGLALKIINHLLSYFAPTATFVGTYVLKVLCKYMDTIVDGVLRIASTAITTAGLDTVTIPEISQEYSTLYGYVTACYKIHRGYCKDLASIRRRSHIIVEPRENGEFYAEGAFGLDILELGFSEYLCKFMGIGPRGSFLSSVGENSIRVAFTLSSRRSYWNPYIQDICFERFSKVTYHITGFWFLNTIIETLLEYLTPKIWGAYVKTLELGLESALREVLDEQLGAEIPIIDE